MGTYAYHKRAKNGWGIGFGLPPTNCSECGAELIASGCTAGYGCGDPERIDGHPDAPELKTGEYLERSPAVCYTCCGKHDAERMQKDGRITLYLSKAAPGEFSGAPWKVSNWPDSLRFPVWGVRKSYHNFAGRDGRVDFWFTAFGREWHGVQIGDTQIARCRAVKGKRA